MPITITEALAEIKTIAKRLDKKRAAFTPYLARQEGVKDPLEKSGGSPAYITAERQSITDLQDRTINLRLGIQLANERESITIEGRTRSIAGWLVWKRDVAPGQGALLSVLRQFVQSIRDNARKQGFQVVQNADATTLNSDFIINLDEALLLKQIEEHESILGQLDGQLSLKNATVMIDA